VLECYFHNKSSNQTVHARKLYFLYILTQSIFGFFISSVIVEGRREAHDSHLLHLVGIYKLLTRSVLLPMW